MTTFPFRTTASRPPSATRLTLVEASANPSHLQTQRDRPPQPWSHGRGYLVIGAIAPIILVSFLWLWLQDKLNAH